MGLSNELISQFAKAIKTEEKTKTEKTVYGTAKKVGDVTYIQLDGSDLMTPISTTAEVKDGDRVSAQIKNHAITITGNITSPSSHPDTVKEAHELASTVSADYGEFKVLTADKLSAMDAEIKNLDVENLDAKYATIENLNAEKAKIETLQADNVDIKGKLTAVEADIENLDVENLDAKYATIENLNATNANVHNLEATYGEFAELTTDKLEANEADISKLKTDKLEAESAIIKDIQAETAKISGLEAETAKIATLEADIADIENLKANKADIESLNGKYANIDFSNIDKATMQYFYAQSGLIQNVVVGDQTITGELAGVTIKGDLIEGNTIKADKLVVRGEDGLYYKLNVDSLGKTTASSDTKYQNGLDGSVIIAKSITATKVDVKDLVAFDATIGGFKITENSLYSGVKASVDNTTRGVYLDNTGQMAIGDSNNYIKYYKDTDGTYKLAVAAKSIVFGAKSLEDALTDVNDAIAETNDTIDNLEIGGRNLLLSSKKLGGDGTTKYWASQSDITTSYDDDGVIITKNATTVRRGLAQDESANPLLIVTPNVPYTLSCYVKAVDGYNVPSGSTIHYRNTYRLSDATTGYKELSIPVPTDLSSTEWVRLERTVIFDSFEYIDNNVSVVLGTEAGALSCKYIKLEKGNKSTDWSPAPEDTLTDINNAVNSIEVGGRNYIINSAEPVTLTGLGLETNATNASIEYVSTEIAESLDGKTVTVSFDYENNVTEGSCGFRVQYTWGLICTFSPTLNTENKRFSYTFDLTDQDHTHKRAFYLQGKFVGSVTLRNIKLEIGNKATDWSPAPEDTDDKIAIVENSVSDLSLTVDNFKTTVSKTYTTKDELKNYSTTSQMNSAIDQKADEITTTVSNTYTTKTEFDSLDIGGRNLLLKTEYEKNDFAVEPSGYQTSTVSYLYSSYAEQILHGENPDTVVISFDWETEAVSGTIFAQSCWKTWSTLASQTISATNQKGHIEQVFTPPASWNGSADTGIRFVIIPTANRSYLSIASTTAGSSNCRCYANINHTANEAYTLSFYAKSSVEGTILVTSVAGNNNKIEHTLTTGWKKYTCSYVASGTGSMSLYLKTANTNADICDVVLTLDSEPDTNIITNGDFANGTTGWSNYNSSMTTFTVTSAKIFPPRSDQTVVKNVKLEFGNKATAWSKAPEDIDTAIEDATNKADSAQTYAESKIEQLADQISHIVASSDGRSLMTQTDTGWTFSTDIIEDGIKSANEDINSLSETIDDTNESIAGLNKQVSELAEYVRIGTDTRTYLHFETPEAGGGVHRIYYTVDGSDKFSHVANTTYLISFYAKSSSDTATLVTSVTATSIVHEVALSKDWQRYSCKYTAAGTGSLTFYLKTANTDVDITNICLEEYSSQGNNLLVNGDFSNGTTNWIIKNVTAEAISEVSPAVILGSVNNDFQTVITNTDIQFKDGTDIPARISNQSLNITNANIENELQIGGFVLKKRANGNVGLMWKGD